MTGSITHLTDVARTFAGRARRRLHTSDDPDVERLRRRLRRARARADDLAIEVSRVKEELAATRASVRDPFPDLHVEANVHDTAAAVVEESLSYLGIDNLMVLARAVLDAERAGRPGAVIECGTALGGSAIVMAAAKSPTRPMRVYDVFGMIPPPSPNDGADVHRRYERIAAGQARGMRSEVYYGYRDDLYGEVTRSFERHGMNPADHAVDLVQGLFEDTLVVDGPVAVAHIDGDWYESTMTCLERITPQLVRGGRIVVDDYYHWSGCRTAVDEYFGARSGYRLERRAKLHVVRE